MDKPLEEVRAEVAEGFGVTPADVEVEPAGMKLGDGIPGVSDTEDIELDSRPPWLEREDRLVRIERKLDRLLELLDE